MEETRGSAIARIPKMISTIAKTSEVPDALFNPSSNMVMIPPDPAVSTQTFARARRMRNRNILR
jgi:hypothetical protein